MQPRILFLMLLGLGLAFTSCNNEANADKALVSEKQEAGFANGESVPVDTTQSLVRFTGYGVGKSHPGNFHLTDGSFIVDGNEVKGGNFTINIQSLAVEEEAEIFQTKLKGHLLNEDFFDAEKYGTARFEITNIAPYQANGTDTSVVAGANFRVSGNLSLKDTTRNISFPAKIDVGNGQIKAVANFNIDRRDWNMRYGNDKSLGDKFISETVNIQLKLESQSKAVSAN